MLRKTRKKNKEVIHIQVSIVIIFERMEGVLMRGQDLGEILWRRQYIFFDLVVFYTDVFNW